MSKECQNRLSADLITTQRAAVRPLNLLFIHHSCGGQLLASPGAEEGANAIYSTHPNGGGLRSLLEHDAFIVHEASYASRIGQNTDIFDWLPKFRSEMEQIVRCDFQDVLYSGTQRNDIVVFKSCFPNNAFVSQGTSPGNPAGPELTVWNAKATYLALLEEFRKRPQVLFVCVTAPPLAPQKSRLPLWRIILKKARMGSAFFSESARLARVFNDWLANDWPKQSNETNVAVFNYYNILTGFGASDLSIYPTGDGCDSHPSREGNRTAAQAFLPFLRGAVQRAQLKTTVAL